MTAKYNKFGRRTIPVSLPKAVVECIDEECEKRQRSRNFVLNEWIMAKCRELNPEKFPDNGDDESLEELDKEPIT